MELPLIIAASCVIIGIIIAACISSARAKRDKEELDRQEAERKRLGLERNRERIYAKYGKTDVADRILDKRVWVGETAEQLRDSLGEPLDIDQKVLKTKKKEIWKYVQTGVNRYGYKFTLENDVVIGWDEKL